LGWKHLTFFSILFSSHDILSSLIRIFITQRNFIQFDVILVVSFIFIIHYSGSRDSTRTAVAIQSFNCVSISFVSFNAPFEAYTFIVPPPGRSICRPMDNIKMDLRERGWRGVDWLDLTQGGGQWRVLVNMVMNLWIP
jgi:hypothetical protein